MQSTLTDHPKPVTNDYFTKYCPHTISSLIGGLPVFFGPLRKLDKGELFSVLRYLIAVVSFDFLAIGKLIELFRTLMKLSGYTTRVHSILHVMKDIHRSQLKDKSVKGKFVSSEVIKFKDVSIVTPANVLLAKHLNFNIEHKRNTTITGPNGCGKSSLFRTLGELWPLKRGTIHKPGGSSGLFKEIFYLPQKPYNVIGSLRDQIIYPDQKSRKTDEELQELLSLHGIGKLSTAHPEGFDGVQDWDRLSRGEQQRLAMARLFYHKPKFAILDECTSCITAVRDCVCECIYLYLFRYSQFGSHLHRSCTPPFHLNPNPDRMAKEICMSSAESMASHVLQSLTDPLWTSFTTTAWCLMEMADGNMRVSTFACLVHKTPNLTL